MSQVGSARQPRERGGHAWARVPGRHCPLHPSPPLGRVALTLGVQKGPSVVLSTARLSPVFHCLSISKAPAHPRVLGAGVAAAGVVAGWGRTAVRSMSPAGRGTKAAAGARPLPLWARESPGPVSHPGTTVETVVPTAQGGHRGEWRAQSPVPGLLLRGWEPRTGELRRRRWKGPSAGRPGTGPEVPGPRRALPAGGHC